MPQEEAGSEPQAVAAQEPILHLLHQRHQVAPSELVLRVLLKRQRRVDQVPRHEVRALLFELVGQGVKVLSENEMLAEQGQRVHTGASDSLNRQFAEDFTSHFAELAKKYARYSHTPEAIREAVDKSMRGKRLSDILYEDRGKR